MTTKNGLRLLLAARKSRKGAGEPYERQDYRAKRWAEQEGHVVINATADTVSSQTAPWKRRDLGPWMTDPAKMALYDGILISDTDRISRGTQEDFVYIEHWASVNGKLIVVAKGPQYPSRSDSERGDWDGQKRSARTYWEATRDKHADTREIIRENGAAIGLAPFGYVITGEKLHKALVIDPVNGPLAREAFRRIAEGRTASSVAIWLTEQTGKLWRLKRVTDMIARRTYLGERDGHEFEALVTRELWDTANAALATRSFSQKPGGRAVAHAYSGLIYCECGVVLYRHKTERGREKYRCGRGRSGNLSEARCGRPGLDFATVNEAVDRAMRAVEEPEIIMVTSGGDHGKQQRLAGIQAAMASAMAKRNMTEVTRLAAEYDAVDAEPSEPVQTYGRLTGRVLGAVWAAERLSGRRAMLSTGQFRLVVTSDDCAVVEYEGDDDAWADEAA